MGAAEPLAAAPRARHPLVEKILSGTAPEAIRLTAARGALPLPLQDLVYAQICLLHDEVPQVVEAATASLAKITGDALIPLLRDPACETVLIDHFVRSGRLTADALEAAIAHPAIMDATLESAAAEGTAETLNLIVTNEVRVIKNPHLLEILRANANLSADNRRRLLELERDFIGKEQLRVRQVPTPAPDLPWAAPPVDALPEGALAGEAAEGAVAEGATEGVPAEGEAGDAAAAVMTEEEEAQYEEALKNTPTFQKIMKMNVAERVQLAMKGSAEERAILIRDTAKMVALQVLKSPKLSDNEISSFAKMRNIHEDMLRVIATRKDWTKTYATVHALVRNPKTPPGLTIQFLPRLGNRDLKIVCGDKNIPELVRRQARNLFLVRTQPPKKMKKKAH